MVAGDGGCEAYTAIMWSGILSRETLNLAEAETVGFPCSKVRKATRPALSLRVSNPRLLIRNGYAIRCLEALQAASERRPWVEFRPLQYESSLHSSIGRSPRKSQPSNTASWRKLTKQWNQALSIDIDPATP